MSKKRSKMGRPPIPEELRKSKVVRVRMTEDEFRVLYDEARRQGVTISELLRRPWRKEQ